MSETGDALHEIKSAMMKQQREIKKVKVRKLRVHRKLKKIHIGMEISVWLVSIVRSAIKRKTSR